MMGKPRMSLTSLLVLIALVGTGLAHPRPVPSTVRADATEPAPDEPAPPPQCNYGTKLDGNGSPHQIYYNVQVSQPITCDQDAMCGATREDSTSISYTVEGGFTADDWISGGFSVQETFTNGDSYMCSGNSGEKVCVWYSIAHTNYTVQNVAYQTAENCDPPSAPFTIASPNQNNDGGGYYCVVDTCRNYGDYYWDYSGPSGGPP